MSELDQNFRDSLEHAKWRYTTQGLKASDRAYEYGILVVKNAFLVSGGGLFFVPTMVGLSAKVEISHAFISGMFFAMSVLLALIANYLIHLNWMMVESSWNSIYEIEKIHIRKAYERSYKSDAEKLEELEKTLAITNRRTNYLFWMPHISVAVFVVLLLVACYYLYLAFGVVWSCEAPCELSLPK